MLVNVGTLRMPPDALASLLAAHDKLAATHMRIAREHLRFAAKIAAERDKSRAKPTPTKGNRR